MTIKKYLTVIDDNHEHVFKVHEIISALGKIAQQSNNYSYDQNKARLELFQEISKELNIPIITAIQKESK